MTAHKDDIAMTPENTEARWYDRIKNRRTYRGPGVYVGRPSMWGNPFVMGKDGSRDEVIDKYRAWFIAQPALVELARRELTGQTLICWCAPLACHAAVLVEATNG